MSYSWLLKPKFLIFVPLLVILLIAVACGEDATPTPIPQPTATTVPQATATSVPPTATPKPAPTSTPAGEPVVQGGIATMLATSNTRTWDPHEEAGVLLGPNFAYNQLLEYNPFKTDEILGDLAESWTLADDQKSYTFVLRKGVKWTDGKDFTADDVVFSINRVISPEEGEVRPITGIVSTYVESVEKINQHTLKIHLKFPSLAFLAVYATDVQKVLPKHHLETGVDLSVFGNSVGTGPFKDVKWETQVVHEIEKNTDYFKPGRPHFDGIKRFIIQDKGTEIAAFKTGRVMMHQIPISAMAVEDIVGLEQDEEFMKKFGIFYRTGAVGNHMIVNAEKAPFDNPKVRRALHLALHRQPIAEGFGLGKFTVGKPMSPGSPYTLTDEEVLKLPGYREVNGKKHPDDIAEAKKLLAEAGYPDGKGFKAIIVAPISQLYPDVVVVIAEQLRDTLGIELETRALKISAFLDNLFGPDFEMAVAGATAAVRDPDFRFAQLYTDVGRNWSRGFEPEVIELFDKQQRETDLNKRIQIAKEMQLKVLTGAPSTMEYYWRANWVIADKRIRTEQGEYVINLGRSVLKHEHEYLVPE